MNRVLILKERKQKLIAKEITYTSIKNYIIQKIVDDVKI